jgi:hypothetical protein
MVSNLQKASHINKITIATALQVGSCRRAGPEHHPGRQPGRGQPVAQTDWLGAVLERLEPARAASVHRGAQLQPGQGRRARRGRHLERLPPGDLCSTLSIYFVFGSQPSALVIDSILCTPRCYLVCVTNSPLCILPYSPTNPTSVPEDFV